MFKVALFVFVLTLLAFFGPAQGHTDAAPLFNQIIVNSAESIPRQMLRADVANIPVREASFNSGTVTLQTGGNPVPTITSLSPNSVQAGSGQFTLTVNGSNFVTGAEVRVNGSARVTSVVSANQLTATILAADVAAAPGRTISVFNPAPGGGLSSGVALTVVTPVPTITSLSPGSVQAGSSQFLLTVSGSNFVNLAQVRVNGNARTTNFVSGNQLTAWISASDVVAAPGPTITVFNSGQGGTTSNGVVLAVTASTQNPAPQVSSLSPVSLPANSAASQITLRGLLFLPTAQVQWNGMNLTTTFYDSTRISASVPSIMLANPGTANITVFNPVPGGGTSEPQIFTITSGSPAPTIRYFEPMSASVGAPVQLSVSGANYTNASKVRFDGIERETYFYGSTQLYTTLSLTDVATPRAIAVTVVTPGAQGGTSNQAIFNITTHPSISSLSPTPAIVGSNFTLTVTGVNLISGAVVRWNGTPRVTEFVSSTQLKATILSSDVPDVGTANVYVEFPGFGVVTNSLPIDIFHGNPIPGSTSLSPNSATVGSGQFQLTVNGFGFASRSVVRWNGTDRATSFVGSTKLTATITAADIQNLGVAQVTVFSPLPGGGTSEPINFTIRPTNPVPVINSLTPTGVLVGGPSFALTISGSNFVPGAIVKYNGADRIPTSTTPTQIVVTILAEDIDTAGPLPVQVFNPAPGGGTSNGVVLNLVNPVPTITSLSPSSVQASSGQFTLTINGSKFVPGTYATVNYSARVTNVVSANQLTVTILAADVAYAPGPTISVYNPAPGGGSSSVVLTVVNPVPTITSLSPSSVQAGTGQFTLTVNGSTFINAAQVRVNGNARSTNFVSGNQLTATIPASDVVAAPGPTITVFNPTSYGEGITSTGVVLAVTAPTQNPVPQVSSLAPLSLPANSAATQLTLQGRFFLPTAQVKWNGVNLTTTFESSSVIRATVPSNLLAIPGIANVTVVNPAPGGGTSEAQLFTITSGSPAPSIQYFSPMSVSVGAPVQLSVFGANYTNASKIRFDGIERETVFRGSTQLSTQLLMTDVATPRAIKVTVVTSGAQFGTSNEATFNITAPPPSISSLSPTPAIVGSDFTLTVRGVNLISGAVVRWNGKPRVTEFVSSTQLKAKILSSDVPDVGTASVFVDFPGFGFVTNSLPINIFHGHPIPGITSLNPNSAAAGSGQFQLTLNGFGFVSGSEVRWNGAPRATLFVNPNELRAEISAVDLAAPGLAGISVFNPLPNGGLSNSIGFTISPPTKPIVRINTATILRGQNGVVTIDLIALGGQEPENSVGFSVAFDPGQLSFVQASAGSGAPGANVTVNTSGVASGQLGIIVAKSAGVPFSPGTNQIAVLNFIPNANGSAGSTRVDFADVPVPRQVVDVSARPLAANWIDGTVTITDDCVYSISPAVTNFSAKGGIGTISVTAGANCKWNVVNTIPWVFVTGGSEGTGNGSITFEVNSNSGINRAGSMDVAGQTFNVRQGARFLDVPEDSIFYEFIGKVSAAGITIGCNPDGTLYCPDQIVTREQMSAFIIRALGEFNPPLPVQQRFADVPPTNVFYSFIDQMSERRITVGCDSQGTNYCPGQAVSREQMSAFMIRALGEFNPPIPAQERFLDVPAANPFFAFIDQMAFRKITLGCNPLGTAYCPTPAVTREQMAAFLVRAFGL